MFTLTISRKSKIEVATLEEASQEVRRDIEANGLGSSHWTGGTVRDERGAVVARVSYNGRVWWPDGKLAIEAVR